jgi:hypothetical protein
MPIVVAGGEEQSSAARIRAIYILIWRTPCSGIWQRARSGLLSKPFKAAWRVFIKGREWRGEKKYRLRRTMRRRPGNSTPSTSSQRLTTGAATGTHHSSTAPPRNPCAERDPRRIRAPPAGMRWRKRSASASSTEAAAVLPIRPTLRATSPARFLCTPASFESGFHAGEQGAGRISEDRRRCVFKCTSPVPAAAIGI